MEQLKAQHQEIAEHKEAIQSLQKQTNDLTNQNNNVKHQVETVTKNLKAIYEATTGHQAVDKDGNDLTPLEMANGITHAARASQSNKEQADKDMVATQEKEKAAKQQQEQQEQLLNQQRQQPFSQPTVFQRPLQLGFQPQYLQAATDYAEEIGYPVIVRPAFTMGGTGGGMCKNREKLKSKIKLIKLSKA